MARKTPACTVCGHNATRAITHDVGTYPLCKQCHEGGSEYEGGAPALAAAVHNIAKRNYVLPLEQRANPGDPHTRKDGSIYESADSHLARTNPAAYRDKIEAQHRASGLFNDRR